MASTSQGAALTEAHRTEQLAVKAAATADALALWGLLDPDDLDGTLDQWLEANVGALRRLSGQSTEVAAAYFTTFAQIETGRFYRPPDVPDIDIGRWRRSLTITGPLSVKSLLTRGHPLDRALQTSQIRTAGEAARLAMYGHRQMLADALNDDYGDNPPPIGYARVTDGDPCAFCAMLAGRGPVYNTSASGGFQAHGHCGCTVEPVFSREAEWPGRSREFGELYNRATREASAAGELRRGTSNDLLNAFRRAYEPTRPG